MLVQLGEGLVIDIGASHVAPIGIIVEIDAVGLPAVVAGHHGLEHRLAKPE